MSPRSKFSTAYFEVSAETVVINITVTLGSENSLISTVVTNITVTPRLGNALI